MSRKIKFRAWEIKGKDFLKINNALITDDGELCETINFSGDLFYHENEEDILIEEFTGVKDKNCVDIYEGDIVKLYAEIYDDFGFKINKEMVGKIIFRNGCFWITSSIGEEALFAYEEDFEVIGNIHENPELLEEVRK